MDLGDLWLMPWSVYIYIGSTKSYNYSARKHTDGGDLWLTQYSVYNRYQITCGTIQHVWALSNMHFVWLSENQEKALLYLPQIKEVKAVAINNVAFAKENVNFGAIKNWSLTAPTVVSWATDTGKNKKVIISIRSCQFPKLSWMNTNKQKMLKLKYFLQGSTYSLMT